ncbi:MAG: polyketide synthase, partial [Desulfobacteraceae bacterium]|nr:polyketide synthase [Desulfobacteraceae bacterium]
LQQVLIVGEDISIEIPQERFNIGEYFCDEFDVGQARGIYTTKGHFTSGMYKKFDANFFRITPREARLMDPQQRLLLVTTWHMFEGNGQKPSALKETHVSHFIGISVCEYQELISDVTDVYMTTNSSLSFTAGRVSYFYGLQGPAAAIDCACSSSLVAIHFTSTHLRDARVMYGIGSGSHLILSPAGFMFQCASSMLSRDGFCKTMDSRADGFSRGEGLASVLLGTSLPMNHLTIDSSAINQDGASGGITVPSKLAQEKLLRSCWQHTEELSSKTIVQLHGTGTKLGDPIEYNALTSVFGVSIRL